MVEYALLMNKGLSETLITVTAVVHNDADIVVNACTEITQLLSQHYSYFELLVIDNGSTDSTVAVIRELQKTIPNIRLIVLSREYESEVAYSAALDHSLGDYIVLMDLLYDPPAMILTMLHKAGEGYDVVIADRQTREDNTWFQGWLVRMFYRVFGNISGFTYAPNASNFRTMSRRAVNSITQIRSKTRYLKHFNALVGFRQTHVQYNRVYRSSTRKMKRENLATLVIRAVDMLISNSLFPLRLVTLLGVAASFLNLLFIVYVFIVSVIKSDVAEGWVSTSLVNSSMFFLLFIILAVISEYIARVLIESKDQPLYFIADEYNSTFLTPLKDRINVV